MPGITTKELMARIGHASPRAALIYQHATRERDRAVASYLDEVVAAAGEPVRRAPVVGLRNGMIPTPEELRAAAAAAVAREDYRPTEWETAFHEAGHVVVEVATDDERVAAWADAESRRYAAVR